MVQSSWAGLVLALSCCLLLAESDLATDHHLPRVATRHDLGQSCGQNSIGRRVLHECGMDARHDRETQFKVLLGGEGDVVERSCCLDKDTMGKGCT